MIPAAFFLAALAAAVVFGVPIWLGLRRLKWESGWLYALGGACGGLVINAVLQGEVWINGRPASWRSICKAPL